MAYPGGIGSRNPSKQTLDRTGKLPARSLERLNHPSFVLSPLTEKRRGNYDVMDVWYSIEIIRRYLTRNFSLTRESCISSSCVFNHEGRRRNLSYFLKENAKHSNYREYVWYVYLQVENSERKDELILDSIEHLRLMNRSSNIHTGEKDTRQDRVMVLFVPNRSKKTMRIFP